MKIHQNQGGISLIQKEDYQENYQPLLVDGSHYPWPQQSTLQKTIRGKNNNHPSFLEGNRRTHSNQPSMFDQASIHHPQQSTIRKDHFKQSSQEESDQGPGFGNFSRFLQDLNESSLAQKRVDLEEDGVASEEEKEEEEEEREPVLREVSREHLRVERISRRAPREELVLNASKLNCNGSQNYYK